MADGLREQKKLQTRQRISDLATAMFIARGFDEVTVAEIAAAAEVSEKTVYNYFPTKESLVFDTVDEQFERLTRAVSERQPGVTVTGAFLLALKQDCARFAQTLGPERLGQINAFAEMVRATPALRAALSEYRNRLVAGLSAVFAAELQVHPEDPEPLVAARALSGLLELLYDSQLRHSRPGVTPNELLLATTSDLDRGARLLETGMWSLHLLTQGRRTKDQISEAAARAERARREVLAALREAKREWHAARHAGWQARTDSCGHGWEAARDARERGRRHP